MRQGALAFGARCHHLVAFPTSGRRSNVEFDQPFLKIHLKKDNVCPLRIHTGHKSACLADAPMNYGITTKPLQNLIVSLLEQSSHTQRSFNENGVSLKGIK
jgi:hypothetical protein